MTVVGLSCVLPTVTGVQLTPNERANMLTMQHKTTGNKYQIVGVKANDFVETYSGKSISFKDMHANYVVSHSEPTIAEDIIFWMIHANGRESWFECANQSLYCITYVYESTYGPCAYTRDGDASMNINAWFIGDCHISRYFYSGDAPKLKVCDCGGHKLKLPHSNWCSTRSQTVQP